MLRQLVVQGNTAIFNRDCLIGVTGSRVLEKESKIRILRFCRSLCEVASTLIISGGALGTDLAAHEGALSFAVGSTCVVLPIELQAALESRRYAELLSCADSDNRVLLLSQFSEEDQDFRSMPLRRNETLAALCNVGIVGPCGIKSGTLSTVRHFLRFGIPFFFLKPEEHDDEEWKMAARYFESVGGKPLIWQTSEEELILAKTVCALAVEEKKRQHLQIASQLDIFSL